MPEGVNQVDEKADDMATEKPLLYCALRSGGRG